MEEVLLSNRFVDAKSAMSPFFFNSSQIFLIKIRQNKVVFQVDFDTNICTAV